jgi:3-hydroxybutyrate dehydrogenase
MSDDAFELTEPTLTTDDLLVLDDPRFVPETATSSPSRRI